MPFGPWPAMHRVALAAPAWAFPTAGASLGQANAEGSAASARASSQAGMRQLRQGLDEEMLI